MKILVTNDDGFDNPGIWALVRALVRSLIRDQMRLWWRRRVLPPGPLRLFRKAFSAIAGQAGTLNISIFAHFERAMLKLSRNRGGEVLCDWPLGPWVVC